jgi:hypothetical protein
VEALLNIFWLLLALTGVHFLVRCGIRRDRDSTPWRAVLALFCAVVLLFPAISCSDDMHPMQATLEDAAVSRRQIAANAQATGHIVLFCSVLRPFPAYSPLVFLHAVQVQPTNTLRLATLSTVSGLRGPPSVSL